MKYRGSPLYPELYCMSVEELESIGKRELAPFRVSDQTKTVLAEKVIPYWQGKTMYDKIMAVMDETWKRGLENGVFSEYSLSRAPGHVNLDGKVVQKGLIGLRKEVEESLKNIDDCSPNCYQQMQELGAMKIAIDAAISFAKRHAHRALELAQTEKDPRRREELKKIAKVCQHVPMHPARSFHEALQSFWFVHLIALLEVNNWALGPGRFDLYMYPFYKKDIESGVLTREEAKELLSLLGMPFSKN